MNAKKYLSTGTFWLLSLAGAFVLQYLLSNTLFREELLLTVFPYDVFLDDAWEFVNSIVVQGQRPICLICGLLGAFVYNYRLGQLLLAKEGQLRYLSSNVWASLVCSLFGHLLGFGVLLTISAGFTMLVVGAAFAALCIPLLALCGASLYFVTLAVAAYLANQSTQSRGVGYRQPARVNTLRSALTGVFPWQDGRFRMFIDMSLFCLIAYGMCYLLLRPLQPWLLSLKDWAFSLPDVFLSFLFKGAISITALGAPFLPLIACMMAAVIYEILRMGPLRKASPFSLAMAAVLLSLANFVALLGLVVAGTISMFWFIALLLVVLGIALRIKPLAILIVLKLAQPDDELDDDPDSKPLTWKEKALRWLLRTEQSKRLKWLLLVGIAAVLYSLCIH